ncbi:MRPS18 [Mytilus edulis]|uniref:RP-S18 n=1 Tax=Mytilus edulis TaxID=6550 RepID=A0A8S3STZ8_MYTED|nr:MRPS18 [Mytilus edulis]
MWKRFSIECIKSIGISNKVLNWNIFKTQILGSSQACFAQPQLFYSSSTEKQSPLEPQSLSKPPEISSFVKKASKFTSRRRDAKTTFSVEKLEETLKELEEKVDYSDNMNGRILSQFVSPNTGRIYGRKITGLCIPMQREISRLIKQSRTFGFMPYTYKKTEYLKDPLLFSRFRS